MRPLTSLIFVNVTTYGDKNIRKHKKLCFEFLKKFESGGIWRTYIQTLYFFYSDIGFCFFSLLTSATRNRATP